MDGNLQMNFVGAYNCWNGGLLNKMTLCIFDFDYLAGLPHLFFSVIRYIQSEVGSREV